MYLHYNPIKYVKGNVCSKCNKPVEKTSKSKVMKFVCFNCKRDRNRERAKVRGKLLSTGQTSGKNSVPEGVIESSI